eukprot:UN11746
MEIPYHPRERLQRPSAVLYSKSLFRKDLLPPPAVAVAPGGRQRDPSYTKNFRSLRSLRWPPKALLTYRSALASSDR